MSQAGEATHLPKRGPGQTPFDKSASSGDFDPASFSFTIPDHTLLRIIGSGSYGQVFLARNTLGNLRAVKVVSRRTLKEERAFQRELHGIQKFEPISRSHPAFLNILHVGHDPNAEYFYCIMELGDAMAAAPGANEPYEPKTLRRVLCGQQYGLAVPEVLSLGISLSGALQHLHKAGLVHRDIKPENILFVDDKPKLADIGLVTDQVEAKTIVGTLGYIPPEGPGTTQADLFALGKVLYESLTGRDRTNFPDLPTNLDRQADPGRFLELNRIVLRACHGPVDERYATAAEFRADLIAVQEGKSSPLLGDLRRQLRKWKLRLTAAAAVMAVAATCAWAYYREQTHRKVEKERTLATWLGASIRSTDEGDYIAALGDLARMVGANERKDQALDRLRFSTTLGQIPKLGLVVAQGSVVGWCGFTPDDRKLLVALDNGKARLIDVESGQSLVELVGHGTGLQAGAISSSGALVATGGRDFTARVWDAATGRPRHVLVHTNTVTSIQFHPTEEQVLTTCADGRIRWWSLADGKLVRELAAHAPRVNTVAVSRDGKFLVSGGRDNQVRVWKANGEPLGGSLLHSNWVLHVALSPDDTRVLVACADKNAYLWDLTTRTRIGSPLPHDRGVSGGTFSPSGRLAFTFGWDGTLRVWETRSGARQNPIIPHNTFLIAGGISHDGARFVTGGYDGVVRIWEYAGRSFPDRVPVSVASADGRHLARANGSTLEVVNGVGDDVLHRVTIEGLSAPLAISDGGVFVAVRTTQNSSPGLSIWNAGSGQRLGESISLRRSPLGSAFVGGDKLFSYWDSNAVHLVPVTGGQRLTIDIDASIRDVAASPDGNLLAVGAGKNVHLRDLAGSQVAARSLRLAMSVEKVVFGPNPEMLLVCTSDTTGDAGYAQVWNVRTGQAFGERLWHQDGVKGGVWFRDGRRVATVSEDGTARIWNVETGQPIVPDLKHRDEVAGIDHWGDDLILTGSIDQCLRVADVRTGLRVGPPMPFPAALASTRALAKPGSLLAADLNRICWVMQLAGTDLETNALLRLADLLAGRPHAKAGLAPREAGVLLENEWRNLKAAYPSLFSVSTNELVAWCRTEANSCFLRGLEGAELGFHRRLLSLRPDDPFSAGRVRQIQGKTKR